MDLGKFGDACMVLKLDGVESTTVYRQLGEGAFKAVILDWLGSYPDPEAYLNPLLSCSNAEGHICLDGEAAQHGDKLKAAIAALQPEWVGRQCWKVPRFLRFLRGWKRMAPGLSHTEIQRRWPLRSRA